MVDILVDIDSFINDIPRGGALPVKSAEIDLGGVGNISVATAYLGVDAGIIGKTGKDLLSSFYIQNLKNFDVQPFCFETDRKNTGFAVSLIDKEKERTFLVYRGANDLLTLSDVTSVKQIIQESKMVYISGYSLAKNPQRKAIQEAARIAQKSNAKLAFDPSSYVIIQQHPQLVQKLAEQSDILLLNMQEAKVLSKAKQKQHIIDFFLNIPTLVVVKEGEKGCTLLTQQQETPCKGFNCSVTDTTGAGDAFNAGFLSLYLQKYTLSNACVFANWFASKVIQQYGARSFPSQKQVDDFLQKLSQ